MDESQPDILDLAQVYALDAVDDQQRLDIDAAVRNAPPHVRREFVTAVRGVHETMAAQSASTAVEPPVHLLGRILDALPGTAASPAPIALNEVRARKRRRL